MGLCVHCTCLSTSPPNELPEKEQWQPNNSKFEWNGDVVSGTQKAILKPSSETGEDMGQFSAGPINKAVPSFTNSLRRVR